MTDQPSQESEAETLYRAEAYQQRGRTSPIDGILRVSAPREWLVLVVLTVAIAGVILWSLLGRLESGINAACALRPAGERHVVVSPYSGFVSETLVEPGSHVSSGDPLVRIVVPDISLAAATAQARAAAVAAQHPNSAEASSAKTEAEALLATATAGSLVLSPANGVLTDSLIGANASVNPGSVVAEIASLTQEQPTAFLTVDSSKTARINTSAVVAIRITTAGEQERIHADGRLSQTSPTQRPLVVPQHGALNTADTLLTAELEDPPAKLTSLAQQSETAYRCQARIITDSRRPIQMLIGRG